MNLINQAKKIGFSNTHIASLIKKEVEDIYDLLNKNGAKNVLKELILAVMNLTLLQPTSTLVLVKI